MSNTALLPAGDLDRRITLEQATVVRDAAFNAETIAEPWPVLATVWANVTEGPRTEDASGNLRLASRRAIFRIRWRSDVAATMRIGYAGQKFRILGDPTEVGRKVALDIEAEAYSV